MEFFVLLVSFSLSHKVILTNYTNYSPWLVVSLTIWMPTSWTNRKFIKKKKLVVVGRSHISHVKYFFFVENSSISWILSVRLWSVSFEKCDNNHSITQTQWRSRKNYMLFFAIHILSYLFPQKILNFVFVFGNVMICSFSILLTLYMMMMTMHWNFLCVFLLFHNIFISWKKKSIVYKEFT